MSGDCVVKCCDPPCCVVLCARLLHPSCVVKLQLQPKQGQLMGCLASVAGTGGAGGAAAPGSGHTISRMM